MIKNDVCLHCGQHKESIKRNKTFCATVTYEGETDMEWSRHRFKPYSPKEIAAQIADEEAYVKQMGDFAEFVKNQPIE
jgi:hypothetical protein